MSFPLSILGMLKGGGQVPADMEFQTNKSGTFSPQFTISSGTLIWDFGDGSALVESNAPSHTYADSTTKTVKVYNNTVDALSTITNVNFASENIVGGLDFTGLPVSITGIFNCSVNSALTGLTFKTSGNTSTQFYAQDCNLSSLDMTGWVFSGTYYCYGNSSLTSITFSTGSNASSNFRVQSNNLSSLNLTNVNLTGSLLAQNNSNLSSITFKSGSTISSTQVYNTSLTSLDLSSVTVTGLLRAYNCDLTSITFSTNANSLSEIQAHLNELTSLDFSNVDLTNDVRLDSNPSLSSITFRSGSNINDLKLGDCNFGTLDFSGITLSAVLDVNSNAITAISWGTIGQFTNANLNSNLLTEAEVDEILNIVQVYSSANAPTANLSLAIAGSGNATPSATGLTDKSTIETNYTNAGYTATITNN